MRFRRKIAVLLLFVVLLVTSLRAEEQTTRTVRIRNPETGQIVTKQVPVAPKEVDPHENTSVLVEAFMVRVSTEALVETGVNPIGQAPEGISILKILACLDDPDTAEVISGSKLSVRHSSQAEMSNNETFYLKREIVNMRQTPDGPLEMKDVRYDAYESGIQFEARPTILQDGVRLSYEYSASGFEENEDTQAPPTRYGMDLSGTVTMPSGKPVIAGGLQAEDSVTFLILTATIQ